MSDIATPIATGRGAPDYAVLYGDTPTVEHDGGGSRDDAYLVTRADDPPVRVHITYHKGEGLRSVTVVPMDGGVAESGSYEPADEHPDRGARWVADGHPDVRLVPGPDAADLVGGGDE